MNIKSIIKRMFIFTASNKKHEFILDNNDNEKTKENENVNNQYISKNYKGLLPENKTIDKDNSNSNEVNKDIATNLTKIKEVYKADINGDFKIREFQVYINSNEIKVFIVYFDGMVDRTLVNLSILQPLMTLAQISNYKTIKKPGEYIKNHLLPQLQITEYKNINKIYEEVNFGGCGIFIDGEEIAFTADVKGWEHRPIGKPEIELTIMGPKEAFNEILRMNNALLRKVLKDEKLICEDIIVGKRNKIPCSMMYIDDIANDKLIKEVRRRLNGIEIDYLIDSGELEQLLEDNTFNPCPQVLKTERPDRAASMLIEGRVVVLVHGSPFAIVMPVNFFDLLHSSEDKYIRFPYATLLRIIRIFAVLFTTLLPGLYIAITNYHIEMIPTSLLLAIVAAREKVPFNALFGILIMEFSFELIREAGIRVPGPIGPTLGIIGGLILGQAAVSANIVSPILIVIVALTGIGSFAIPDINLGYSFRTFKFVYIFFGAFLGFPGISLCLFIHLLLIVGAKSFGVPFFVPIAPRLMGKGIDTINRAPVWNMEQRPDFLNTKKKRMQPIISRKWIEKKNDTGDTENEQ